MRIHRLTIKDYIINIFLKFRYEYYRLYNPNKLSNHSEKEKENHELVFFDDFNETSWGDWYEDKNWIPGEGWGAYHPNNKVCYFAEPEIRDGKVIFSSRYEPKEFYDKNPDDKFIIPIAVSWLSSVYSFKQKYGRFECRMTIPKEKASSSAFWLWGPVWPPEIDVIECHRRDGKKREINQEINIYYKYEGSSIKSIKAWKIHIDNHDENLNERFHEFAIDWTPNKIKFYTNGIFVFQITNKKLLNYLSEQNEGMHVVINNNVQSKFLNTSEYNTYYSEFTVDYIRVYKKTK